jgi:hypothetical protein
MIYLRSKLKCDFCLKRFELVSVRIQIADSQLLRFKSIVSNMNTTVHYVELYKAKNGYYPQIEGWSFQGNSPIAAQRNAYIPGIVPTIARELPMTDDNNGSFLYASNGTDYKIIRYAANGIKPAEWSQVPDSMKDSFGKANLDRYGYWSPGGAGF